MPHLILSKCAGFWIIQHLIYDSTVRGYVLKSVLQRIFASVDPGTCQYPAMREQAYLLQPAFAKLSQEVANPGVLIL